MRKIFCYSAVQMALLLFFCTAVWAGEYPVPIVFKVPHGTDPSTVFVHFVNTADTITGTYYDSQNQLQTLEVNKAYSLAEITSSTSLYGAPANMPAVAITNYVSGRVYISLGEALTDLGDPLRPQPVANDTSDPNYYKRYQYFEPTIKLSDAGNTNLWADLSYIDFAAISLSLELVNASTANNSPQRTSANGHELVKTLANTAASGQDNILPIGSGLLPDTSFARVVAPNINGNYYHDWTYFLKTVAPGKTVTIKGLYAGTGQGPWSDPTEQQQTYHFIGTFASDGSVTLTAQSDSGNGQSAATPSNLQGAGVGYEDQSIYIPFDQLNLPIGIYGNNPAYTIKRKGIADETTAGITNDVFGWVVGDLLAGICFGFVTSTKDFDGQDIGDMDSCDWWGGLRIDGTKLDGSATPAGQNIVFRKVQTDKRSYHYYAAQLLDLSPAYGFPLQDRMDRNLMTYDAWTDQNGYLKVIVNPDKHNTLIPITKLLDD